MTFALIPAGGKSTRMGRPKLALPLHGLTVLEHVIAALRAGGVDRILVVVSPHASELVPLAADAGADTMLLGSETADMRATVEQGLSWVERQWPCQPEESWLLVPADHPTLNASVVKVLLAACRPNVGHTIIIPTYEGRRGHPCLLTWKHAAGIRALTPGLGINSYLRDRRDETLELPVSSPDILVDLDTPEDYERLLRTS